MNKSRVYETHKTGMAYLLWCSAFLGFCGLHRFYLGKYVTGALWLATGGLLGVGQFIDLFFISGMVENENLRKLKRQSNSGDIYHHFPQEQIVKVLKTTSKSDTQIILRLAKNNPQGISLADCIIATNKTTSEVRELLKNLYKEELIEMENHPETGAIIYKII